MPALRRQPPTMRILFLTPTEVGDRSFGGALRVDAMRTSLTQVGDVHTFVTCMARSNATSTPPGATWTSSERPSTDPGFRSLRCGSAST
jgi:hypothetical protein